jgi:hypothetical protein
MIFLISFPLYYMAENKQENQDDTLSQMGKSAAGGAAAGTAGAATSTAAKGAMGAV